MSVYAVYTVNDTTVLYEMETVSDCPSSENGKENGKSPGR